MSEDSKIEQFASSLRGRLILRDNPEYDHARTIFNAMIDKRPRMIARCTNVADVIAAVNFGRDRGLDTSIRGGGHNGPGLALVDDGLVIDLSSMKGIRVDPEARNKEKITKWARDYWEALNPYTPVDRKQSSLAVRPWGAA